MGCPAGPQIGGERSPELDMCQQREQLHTKEVHTAGAEDVVPTDDDRDSLPGETKKEEAERKIEKESSWFSKLIAPTYAIADCEDNFYEDVEGDQILLNINQNSITEEVFHTYPRTNKVLVK